MTIDHQLQRIHKTFLDSLSSVHDLLNFDRIVLDFAIRQIRDLVERLTRHHQLDNPRLTAINTLQILEKIRDHDSLRIQYKRVFNQCLVLLVSHFSSTIRDVFQCSIDEAIGIERFDKINRAQISLSLQDLKSDTDKERSIGEILAVQKDISFQDMQSIARAFQEYFLINIPKDNHVNNIIVAQAFRHGIVHSGAKIDKRLVKQVEHATPRDVKDRVALGEEILFTPDEVSSIGSSMEKYLAGLLNQLTNSFSTAS